MKIGTLKIKNFKSLMSHFFIIAFKVNLNSNDNNDNTVTLNLYFPITIKT